MLKKTLICAFALSACAAAQASVQIDDIVYEDAAAVKNAALELNGAGLRKKVFFKVYSAGLYLPARTSSSEEVLASAAPIFVRLGLLRDVDASTFVDALKEGLLDNSSKEELDRISSEVDALVDVMNKIGDVKTGDLVDFQFDEESLTSVSLNGRVLGERIGGRELFNAVLRIWIGENAIDSSLKKSLLGG